MLASSPPYGYLKDSEDKNKWVIDEVAAPIVRQIFRMTFGMTQKAVTETIRICKDRNVLREYLLEREKEVVTIMVGAIR